MNNNRQQQRPGPGREAIVDKLHGVLASFRRERDDLHREKELAQERLRLIREEREAVERTVRAMQSKLDELQRRGAAGRGGGGGGQDDGTADDGGPLAGLRAEVDGLDREAKFQHADLVGKREKYVKLEKKVRDDARARATSLSVARDAVRRRREMQSLLDAAEGKHGLEDGRHEERMDVDGSEEDAPSGRHLVDSSSSKLTKLSDDVLLDKLPVLVKEKADKIMKQASEVNRSIEVLQRRRDGYRGVLGISS